MRRLLPVLLLLALPAAAAETVPTGAFAFTLETVVPGAPETVYDAATGDVSGWWDHTMSGHPLALVIEARPGGAFLETYDASGDGVRHAVVTGAVRGELLRMEGPLGLAGHALHMITTWTFSPVGADSTRFAVEVHAAGEVHEGWPDVVERTWRHFLIERFAPFMKNQD